MKLYLCQDGTYAGTQADAKLRGKTFDAVEVPIDKPGLLSFLNQQFNAVRDLRPEDSDQPVKDVNEDVHPERAPSYTETSVGGDEWFEGIPLAHQLTLANLALENARTELVRLKNAERGGLAKPAPTVETDPFA